MSVNKTGKSENAKRMGKRIEQNEHPLYKIIKK